MKMYYICKMYFNLNEYLKILFHNNYRINIFERKSDFLEINTKPDFNFRIVHTKH